MSASCARSRSTPVAEARRGMRVEDSAAGGRPGSLLPPGGGSGRRWRDLAGDALLVSGLCVVFPVSLLLYVAAGQVAAVSACAVALGLMLAGWAVGRG